MVPGRRELPPLRDQTASAFVDVSGGRSDAFSVALGHKADDRVVVDVCRAWQPPFNPSSVVEECSELLKTYRVSRVVGDRYGGEWPVEAFREQGITYELASKTKSELYLAFVATINGQRIELPEDEALLRELRSLERKRGHSGKDRVDHPSRAGAHDDRANCAAGLSYELLRRNRGVGWEELYGDGGIYFDEDGNWRPL